MIYARIALLAGIVALVASCSSTASHSEDAAIQSDGPAIVDATADANADASTPTFDPAMSTIVTDRDTATAGVDTVTVTVTVHDHAGQPLANVTVQLLASGTGNVLSTPPPTDSAGVT